MYKYISIILRTISVILSVITGTIIGLDIIPVESIEKLPMLEIIYIMVGTFTIILLMLQIIAAFFIQNTKFDFILAIALIILIIVLWVLNPDIKFPYVCGIISDVSFMLGNLKYNKVSYQNN